MLLLSLSFHVFSARVAASCVVVAYYVELFIIVVACCVVLLLSALALAFCVLLQDVEFLVLVAAPWSLVQRPCGCLLCVA